MPINIKLSQKPSGCIIWIIFDEDTLSIQELLWFGSQPNAPIPSLGQFTMGHHTRFNARGHRPPRPNIRELPKSAFERLPSISVLATKLFGVSNIAHSYSGELID